MAAGSRLGSPGVAVIAPPLECTSPYETDGSTMYDKRAIWAVTGLATVAVLAGCASTKEGTGSFAGGSVAPTTAASSGTPTQTPTGMPTTEPPTSAEPSVVPTTAPPPTAAGNVNLSDDGAICQLFTDAQLQQIWGQKPRLFPDSGGPGCTFKNADGDQVIIDEFDNLVPSQQLDEDKKGQASPYSVKSLTIGGRPAKILLDSGDFGDGYIYVAETTNFNGEGVVEALVSNDPKLQQISKSLLAIVVPKYAH